MKTRCALHVHLHQHVHQADFLGSNRMGDGSVQHNTFAHQQSRSTVEMERQYCNNPQCLQFPSNENQSNLIHICCLCLFSWAFLFFSIFLASFLGVLLQFLLLVFLQLLLLCLPQSLLLLYPYQNQNQKSLLLGLYCQGSPLSFPLLVLLLSVVAVVLGLLVLLLLLQLFLLRHFSFFLIMFRLHVYKLFLKKKQKH